MAKSDDSTRQSGNRGHGRPSDATPFDPADAWRQAARHHGAGRLSQAEAIYRKILTVEPDNPFALHLLGVVTHQAGRSEHAAQLIARAVALKPDYAEAHNNLGNVLLGLGRVAEAMASYRRALAIKPKTAKAHNNLGNALKEAGRLDDAVASYRTALAIVPDYPEAHNNLGNALQALGRPDEAVASFAKALALRSDYAAAHNSLGNALRDRGCLDDAETSYRRAIALRPDYAEAHCNLAGALRDLGRPDDAVAGYEKALALKPDYAAAHNNLAELLEKTNRTDALRAAVSEFRRHCPGHPRLAKYQALLLKRAGDFAAARALLEDSASADFDADHAAARQYLLAEICDRLGDTDTAFALLRDANRRRRETADAQRHDGPGYLKWVDRLAQRFTADWIAGWDCAAPNDGRSDPVFLVGFPRSGTTLLDSVLRSHPDICVVEEKPTVLRLVQALVDLPGGCPDGLAGLDETALAAMRPIYFEALDTYSEDNRRPAVVIDKLPLNMVEAGIIHRVLPQARFLFVLRHPCDSVLSCFMQDFQLNPAMANFLNLGDAARLYDKVMRLWLQYRTLFPLSVHVLRYEDLVRDFEETVTSALCFLRVAWDDRVRDYAATARRRERIYTTSYNQVTEPLYTRAQGRWERYREHMEPVLPLLLPWAERFGYGT